MHRRSLLFIPILFWLAVDFAPHPAGAADAAEAVVPVPAAERSTALGQADRHRQEGSHRLAYELYGRILAGDGLDAESEHHARFGEADARWRERSGGEEAAQKTLERMVEDLPLGDAWRAEAAESLGDLMLETRPWDLESRKRMVEAWIVAVDYWGSAVDLDAARPRYVALNFKIAGTLIQRFGGYLPIVRPARLQRPDLLPSPPPDDKPWRADTSAWALRNVLRVVPETAAGAEDRTHALFLLGRQRVYLGVDDAQWVAEGEGYLEQSTRIEPRNEWTDDALIELAQLQSNRGRHVDAVGTLSRFLELYRQGESAHHERAVQMRDEMVEPSMNVSGGDAFAPGSHIRLDIYYRNLDRARLVIRRIEPDTLLNEWRESEDGRRSGRLSGALAGRTVHNEPIEEMVDERDYVPHNKTIYIDPLAPGIYHAEVASAASEERSSRFVQFIVSSAAAAAKHHDLQSQIWVVDAEAGSPRPDAIVRMVYGYRRRDSDQPMRWQQARATTDADGVARFERKPPLSDERNYGSIFVLAHDGNLPALLAQSRGYAQTAGASQGEAFVYAWSDRSAYRPDEPIHWKGLLRFSNGEGYRLPDVDRVYIRLRDARSNPIEEGYRPLDANGSFGGEFTVDRAGALGIVSLEVTDDESASRRRWSQSVQLCRIEEYKLPEFRVAVEAAGEQVRFGDTVPFTIQADYYFGGPVAGASAQIVVHRTAFWPRWNRPMPFDWFYSGGGGRNEFMGRSDRFWFPHEPERIVLEETVTLDAEGRARVAIGALTDEESKAAAERGLWGYEYRVEARVTDLSRREIVGNGSIKVALTAFAAYLNPQRFVYLPGDPVKVDLTTRDPNDRPVAAEGLATIFKRVWNPDRKNAAGEAAPDYDDTELFTKPATTGADGEGEIVFEPEREGYYLVRFATKDRFGKDISGETTVFVCSEASDAVGYRAGGVEIILDSKSHTRGGTAHAMIATRRPGVAVWFGIEGETIHETRVVRLDGTVRLVPIEIRPEYEPNVFLTAHAFFDYSGFSATEQLLVPPTRRFLDVTLTTEKADYRPGEKATIAIQVRDDEGKAVTTPLSLGVADAAVWAIQGDLAPDIRQFFWGRRRPLQVRTDSTANRYAFQFWKPVEGKPGEFELWRRERIADERVEAVATSGSSNGMLGRGGRGDAVFRQKASVDLAMAESMPMAAGSAMVADEMALGGIPGPEAAEPRVRTNFSATALWLADVVTDADGRATAEVTWPDSLTTWKAVARAADRETRVGQVTHEVKTNKPIMVRPQAPRFFIEGDVVTLSAIVNNNTDAPQTVTVRMDLDGLVSRPPAMERLANLRNPDAVAAEESTEPVPAIRDVMAIRIPANSQRRVDWPVYAETVGTAKVTMSAVCPVDSDAAEKTYPVYEYGIEQFIAAGTSIREAERTVEKTLTLRIPEARRPGSESLTIRIEPTLARSMVDALPYLADYPYGCVEQTLSRFVPAVITARVLDQLGIENADLKAKLPDMIKAGLDRLYDFQHDDGGWAWWKTGDSDPFMTAYVLAGLAQAVEAGVEVRPDVLERAAQFLALHLVDFEDQPDMAAFGLYALGAAGRDGGRKPLVDAAHERLWPIREQLNPYTRALFALACHHAERTERAQTLVRNMRNGVIEDAGNGAAHWGESGVYWRWSQGGVEATAFSLRALLAIDPENAMIDPAMTWLVRNRRGSRWKSTRDTAVVIGALADYIVTRGEDKPDWTCEVRVNGTTVKTLTVEPGAVFDFDGVVEIPADLLKSGENSVTISRNGTGVLYASAWLTYFTREEKIPAAGNEVLIQRKYFRVREGKTLSGEYRPVRVELQDGDPLKSGDRVEVEMRIEAKNHYEYLLIEDRKAAGMEAVDVQSGWNWGGSGVSAHRELRDERTAFFVSSLPEGDHVILYTLRAEIPGVFHALPSTIEAMYVPEIRANSEGRGLKIED